ncbi:MAG: hypothetical protein HKO76_10555 [Acidimicrobiia bacterium]|nr:hypothetical protein [Acidimicrobiia bacterium]
MTILRRLAAAAIVIGLGMTALGLAATADWRLGLIVNFRLQLLFGFMILVAIMIAVGDRRWLVPAVAGLAINAILVGPWFGFGLGTSSGESVTVLHLNLLAANRDTAAVVELLHETDADIAFLAEATASWRRRLRLVEIPFDVVATPGDVRFGIIALSKIPVETRVLGVSTFQLPTPLLSFDLDGEPITVMSFHTTSPVNTRRDAARDEQLMALSDLVSSVDGHGVLIGDLNATPWTPGMSLIEDAGYQNSLRSSGLQPSWPAGLGPFMIPIDHAFHSEGLEVIDRRTVASSGSDHLGVEIELAVKR